MRSLLCNVSSQLKLLREKKRKSCKWPSKLRHDRWKSFTFVISLLVSSIFRGLWSGCRTWLVFLSGAQAKCEQHEQTSYGYCWLTLLKLYQNSIHILVGLFSIRTPLNVNDLALFWASRKVNRKRGPHNGLIKVGSMDQMAEQKLHSTNGCFTFFQKKQTMFAEH